MVQLSGGWGTAQWWWLGYGLVVEAGVRLGGGGWGIGQYWRLGYSSVVEAGVWLTGGKLGYGSVIEPSLSTSKALYSSQHQKKSRKNKDMAHSVSKVLA